MVLKMSLNPFPLVCHPNTLSSCLNGGKLLQISWHHHQYCTHQHYSTKQVLNVGRYHIGGKNQLMADHLMVSVEKKSVISNQVRVVSERELRNSNGCSSKPLGRKVSDKFEAQAFFLFGLLTVNAASAV